MVPRFSLRSAGRLRDAALCLWNAPERMEVLLRDGAAPSAAELAELYAADDPLQLCPPGRIVWMGRVPWSGDRADSPSAHDTADLPVVVVDDPVAEFRDLRISRTMFSIHVPQNYLHRFSD